MIHLEERSQKRNSIETETKIIQMVKSLNDLQMKANRNQMAKSSKSH